MKKKLSIVAILILTLGGFLLTLYQKRADQDREQILKLYWFIPDGLRAEPDLFTIYKWADQGLLPNLKKMMLQGSYGYSIPSFPGHTPVNFASLLTGATPEIHGVADGPMHIEGYPLKMVSKSGFSSTAKKVPPISFTLEERNYLVSVLSVPGTTPPELDMGITLKGRWGGWGVDFPAVIFQSVDHSIHPANNENRVFYSGPELTRLGESQKVNGWRVNLPKSYSTPQELELSNWNSQIFAFVYDSRDDQKEEYDRILFSTDKESIIANLSVGEWSSWLPVQLGYEIQNDYNINTPKKKSWESSLSQIAIDSHLKIKVIKLGEKGFYRLRFFYNSLNEFSVQPSVWYERLNSKLGPMVDFPDSYPAQLIHFEEDKQAFLEESAMSFDWHKNLVRFAIKEMKSNAVIHNIYSPNQMLTSRWWLGYIDPQSARYKEKSDSERQTLKSEVVKMYQQVDAILGEILEHADENTVVVFGSDHGVVPYNKEVRLNNLFAKQGWLKFSYNKKLKTYEVDWPRTKVIYLQMDGIYINPEGLGGNYVRASGPKYEQLRERVIKVIENLEDGNGEKPLEKFVKWEDGGELDLPLDRTGDLTLANRVGYNWVETLSEDLKVFFEPLPSGYKQAVIGDKNKGMWTPFVIMGPGVKKDFFIKEPIHHIQQYPTIMKLLKEEPPSFVEGQPLAEIFEEKK